MGTKLLEVSEFTPEKIGNRLFSIPLYQRLYAWESEQVKQLLDDLYDTFCNSKGAQYYFIGNIVASQTDARTNRQALIDGQQRMTTFWLMGFVLRQYHPDWNQFILHNSFLRLDFLARKDDRAFLEKLAATKINDFSKDNIVGDGVNYMMKNTIDVVCNYFDSIDSETKNLFARYIYEKAKVVVLSLPKTTDLNKYFEIMNNRGVQLEKHEILKARILDRIWDNDEKTKEAKRIKYSIIWDACAQMNRDIEKSFEKPDGSKIDVKKEIRELIKRQFANMDDFISKLSEAGQGVGKSLNQILIDAENTANETEKPNVQKEFEDKFSAVVNFPTFLLHIYKLFKSQNNTGLKDKDLLKNIQFNNLQTLDTDEAKKENSSEAERFIKELFIYRILFDQYIIRSYKTDKNNLWETRILTIEEEGDERKKAFENATQILAMLNVSTSSEYWLTPLLKYLRTNKTIEDIEYTQWLENMDNCFAYTRTTDENRMMETANRVLENLYSQPEGMINIDNVPLSIGVRTKHYWFFKLDYCLWKLWSSEGYNGRYKNEIKSFQFRSNRSVEHVYPQNPENKVYWESEILNSFGNLALISVSSNSGYNNQLPDAKKHDFEKRVSQWGIESLKLVDVYQREWNQDVCKTHEKEMIKILKDYHLNTSNYQS
jgi:uncharacterized protein with ParB-like and HNH nuclease domain